jgi:hypothetical protein
MQHSRARRERGKRLLLIGSLLFLLGVGILSFVLIAGPASEPDTHSMNGAPPGPPISSPSNVPTLIASITGLVTAAGGLVAALAGLIAARTAARQTKR